jgi:hypothetical protein
MHEPKQRDQPWAAYDKTARVLNLARSGGV